MAGCALSSVVDHHGIRWDTSLAIVTRLVTLLLHCHVLCLRCLLIVEAAHRRYKVSHVMLLSSLCIGLVVQLLSFELLTLCLLIWIETALELVVSVHGSGRVVHNR